LTGAGASEYIETMAGQGKRAVRRTQEQRRLSTQAAILAAAVELLAEIGYARFSASGVAARAGVSRGALEHYYPRKIDLCAAATEHAMREAVAHARSLAEPMLHTADPVAKFLADSEHFFFSPVYRAMVEIMVAASSEPALAAVCDPIVQDARVTLNAIWTDTLGGAGYSRQSAERFIELTHYLLRGVFLVETWLPYPVDRAAIVATWRALAPTALRLAAAPAPARSRKRAAT
jgi:AcrR family transcriptional regulator